MRCEMAEMTQARTVSNKNLVAVNSNVGNNIYIFFASQD